MSCCRPGGAGQVAGSCAGWAQGTIGEFAHKSAPKPKPGKYTITNSTSIPPSPPTPLSNPEPPRQPSDTKYFFPATVPL